MLDSLLFVSFSKLLVLAFTAVLVLEGEVDLLGPAREQRAAPKPSPRAQGKQQRAV